MSRDQPRSPAALPVPDILLVPVLDTAAEVFGHLSRDEIPPALRPLAGFDRRGLVSGPARQQLRRALETDAAFRKRVSDTFLDRDECVAVLETWSLNHAFARVDDAVERADLPLLASTLYAAEPVGFEFALGVVVAAFERLRHEHELGDEVKAREAQVALVEEAKRRAENARDDAQAQIARLEQELRDERRSRRDREVRANAEVEDAHQKAREAEAALAQARASTEGVEARVEREASRARQAERQLRELRREFTEREREQSAEPRAMRNAELEIVDRATEQARGLMSELDGLSRFIRDGASRGNRPRPTSSVTHDRHKTIEPPRGLVADSREGLDAMLRNRGVILIVDGYNVSMRAWPKADVADQRDRLISALASLHLRMRTESVVVFDGADIEGIAARRRPGVRVAFSRSGEEADRVVVREVSSLLQKVPVVVASSDKWVQQRAEREGATVVSADTLLELLRR